MKEEIIFPKIFIHVIKYSVCVVKNYSVFHDAKSKLTNSMLKA